MSSLRPGVAKTAKTTWSNGNSAKNTRLAIAVSVKLMIVWLTIFPLGLGPLGDEKAKDVAMHLAHTHVHSI